MTNFRATLLAEARWIQSPRCAHVMETGELIMREYRPRPAPCIYELEKCPY